MAERLTQAEVKEYEVCKKVIKIISRMGNISKINNFKIFGEACWADVNGTHTIEDNEKIIKGIDIKNYKEDTVLKEPKLVKVFIEPQIIDDIEINEVIFDLK